MSMQAAIIFAVITFLHNQPAFIQLRTPSTEWEYLKNSDGVKTSLPYKEGIYSFIEQNQNSMPLLSCILKTKRNHHCSVDNKNFSLVISSAKSMDKKFCVNFFFEEN